MKTYSNPDPDYYNLIDNLARLLGDDSPMTTMKPSDFKEYNYKSKLIREYEKFSGKFTGENYSSYAIEVVAPGLDTSTIEVSIEKIMPPQTALMLTVKAKTLGDKEYTYSTCLLDLSGYEVDNSAMMAGNCTYSAGIIYITVPVKKINNVVYSVKVSTNTSRAALMNEGTKNKANLTPQDA